MIDADHGQFYVPDLDPYDAWIAEHAMDPDLAPAGWTDEAVFVHRIGVEPHSISVGTVRDDMVESLQPVSSPCPAPGPILPTGSGMTVPSGLLCARFSYVPAGPSSADTKGGAGDHFLYQVDLWPSGRAHGLVIFKQGPEIWAGSAPLRRPPVRG
ncbi:UNVERIFIED_CONTAM: hypothetical protein RKD50_009307 [Streptomyces canus]